MDWLAQLVGLPRGANGLLVSGGSMANLVALAGCREAKLPGTRRRGVRAAARQPTIYASSEAPSCIRRAPDARAVVSRRRAGRFGRARSPQMALCALRSGSDAGPRPGHPARDVRAPRRIPGARAGLLSRRPGLDFRSGPPAHSRVPCAQGVGRDAGGWRRALSRAVAGRHRPGARDRATGPRACTARGARPLGSELFLPAVRAGAGGRQRVQPHAARLHPSGRTDVYLGDDARRQISAPGLRHQLPLHPGRRTSLYRYHHRAGRAARAGADAMTELLHRPWPWYVTGPLLGLVAVSLLAIGNKPFGVSSNLRHIWAACLPGNVAYFKYDWRRDGLWNLAFILGVVAGGFVGGVLLANPHPVAITPAAVTSLAKLGIHDFSGLVPRELFTLHMLLTPRGFLMFIGGGVLFGVGAAYAGGCTAGARGTRRADLQLPSPPTWVAFFSAGAAAGLFVVPPLLSP